MGVIEANRQRVKIPSWVAPTIVYAISIGCLVWVYRDFDWHHQLPRLKRIHWMWILLAASTDILVYVSQAWRWNLLLKPVVEVPILRSVQAIYIGLFANELLPLRSGEAIRCYLQSHWSNISFPVALSSALIERMLDGIWLILGFFLTTFFVRLDNNLKYGASILALLVVALALLLGYAVHRRSEAHDALARYRWLSVLRHLIEGLHAMGQSRSFYMAAAASVLYLGLQVVPIYAMIRGYGVDLSFGHAAVVLVVLRLGTIIPGPPGNIGFFNAFAVAALTLLGVDRQTAKGLSGVMFFVITVPLLLAGCIAIALTGLKLGELQRKAQSHLRRRRPEKTLHG
ncbi:MAG: flippase-like domain-containing protein [Bryobacterales bacterium]|nr:flippase-like domain-containing protein [Bryobacterales bacterium]